MSTHVKANFFIVGMPRSGTTSLYTYLKQHPDIFLSIYKEPNFFSKDLSQSAYNIQDREGYDSLFAGAEGYKAVGEGSVWYLTSRLAAQEIHRYNPGSRFIVMLRNPIDMIYSLHDLYLRTGNDDVPDFGQALAIQARRIKGEMIPPACYFREGLYYTEVAGYYEKIKRFVDVFGRDRIHLIVFDDFSRDMGQSCRETFRFLGVDAGFPVELDLKKASALIRPLVWQQIRTARPEIKQMVSKKMGETHGGPAREKLDPALRKRLSDLFKEDIARTSQLIGRDLTAWCP